MRELAARARHQSIGFVVAICLLTWMLTLAGCATSRGIMDIQPKSVANPASGPIVKIARVTDQREFQLKPPDPSIPSLKYGEIDNSAITSRAIARKRNSYGKAMGDILLPEDRTVEQIAEEAIIRGLRESGFQVLEEGDVRYEEAVPLEADIYQFWAWLSPGFWAAHLEFDLRIRLTGAISPFEEGQEFKGYVRLSTQAATTRAWRNTIAKGLENLNENMTSRLRAVEVNPS